MLDRFPPEVLIVIVEQSRISNNLIELKFNDRGKVMELDSATLKAMCLVHSSCTGIAQAELFKQIYISNDYSMDRFVEVVEGSDRLRGYASRATSLMISNNGDEDSNNEDEDSDKFDGRKIEILCGGIRELYIAEWDPVTPADLGTPLALYGRIIAC
jgi:hypothetical protein